MAKSNLGLLMMQAGVEGAKRGPMTVDEARQLARRQEVPAPSGVAMSRLPIVFDSLRAVKDGREFIKTLEGLLREESVDFNAHVLRGLVQLVHYLHDSEKGSRRTSYNRAICILQTVKAKAEKNAALNVRAHLLREI